MRKKSRPRNFLVPIVRQQKKQQIVADKKKKQDKEKCRKKVETDE